MRSAVTCKDDSYLVCDKDNDGEYHWSKTHSAKDDTGTLCPENSIPYKTLGGSCFGYEETTCWTEDDGNAAFCTFQIDADKPQYARELPSARVSVSHNVPVSQSDLLRDFEACAVQLHPHASNTALVSYVQHGEEEKCAKMIDDISTSCDADKCKPVSVYANTTQKCTINDSTRYPISHPHDNGEWFRWRSEHTYSCKSDGWSCSTWDEKPSAYMSPKCAADCIEADDVSHDLCNLDTNKCLLSPTISCKQHAECTIDNTARRQHCADGSCKVDKTGVDMKYWVPAFCKPADDKNPLREYKHNYCGATEDGFFNGVCSRYEFDGVTYSGCQPFMSQEDVNQIFSEEETFQSQPHRQRFNFTSPDLPYKNLKVCAKTKKTDTGETICETTTQKVNAHTDGTTCDALLPIVA